MWIISKLPQLNVYNDFNVLSINVYIVYKLKSQINFPPAYKFAWVKEFEFDLFLNAEVAADFSEDRTYGVTLRIQSGIKPALTRNNALHRLMQITLAGSGNIPRNPLDRKRNANKIVVTCPTCTTLNTLYSSSPVELLWCSTCSIK